MLRALAPGMLSLEVVEMERVVELLNAIAPLELAAPWDNVGLLVQGDRPVRTVFFTIDLSERVFEEAMHADADLIVAYHPPIFRGLKRLTQADPQGRLLLRLARAGLHLYSPHTALDAAVGGMNDWLLQAFGELTDVSPIQPSPRDPKAGFGRTATLVTPTSVAQLVDQVRAHLKLRRLRVATPDGFSELLVRTVAVCPGSGGEVFEGVEADLVLTGEMRHHDVLHRVQRGGSVLLTDHTNTERGYLVLLAKRIELALGCEVVVSTRDRDPLVIT